MALDKRVLHVLLIGAGAFLFFKPNVLEVSWRVSGVELWEGARFRAAFQFERYLFFSGRIGLPQYRRRVKPTRGKRQGP